MFSLKFQNNNSVNEIALKKNNSSRIFVTDNFKVFSTREANLNNIQNNVFKNPS